MPSNFLARYELHHRLLRLLLEQRHRYQHFHPIHRRCRVSLVCSSHVSQSWCTMGHISARFSLCGLFTGASPLLQVWCKDSREVKVHSHGLTMEHSHGLKREQNGRECDRAVFSSIIYHLFIVGSAWCFGVYYCMMRVIHIWDKRAWIEGNGLYIYISSERKAYG